MQELSPIFYRLMQESSGYKAGSRGEAEEENSHRLNELFLSRIAGVPFLRLLVTFPPFQLKHEVASKHPCQHRMRYFHYVSDSKVEMLSQQLQSRKSALNAEIGINVGVINGKIGVDHSMLDDRITRLEKVESHLRKNDLVGTIESPKRWIEGTATAIATRVNEDSKAVFYFIRTEHVYLAIGGSVGNLISAHPDRKLPFGASYAGWLINSLAEIDRFPDLFFLDDKRLAEYAECGVSGDHPWSVMIFNQCAHRRATTFNFPIRFLAHRILEDSYRGKRVILASPLYVEAP